MMPVAPDFWSQLTTEAAQFATGEARISLEFLITGFGPASEPDYSSLLPVYDRMLAIALLILGAIVAFALVERILGGKEGAGWSLLARVVAAVAFAYGGLSFVQYLGGYASALATAWSPDLQTLSAQLQVSSYLPAPHLGSVLGLVFMGLLLVLLCLLVYLELVVRSALILVVSAFIPFVCVLGVWPRLAPAAGHLAEFLVGLLLSKFVVATALYVGLRLSLPALTGQGGDWLATGIAVLLIAAFSPLVLFGGLKFAHATSGKAVRDLGGHAIRMAPTRAITGIGAAALAKAPLKAGTRAAKDVAAGVVRSES